MIVQVIPLEKLRKILDVLKEKDGPIGFISLYIPPHKTPLDIINYLRGAVDDAQAIKNAVTRNRVTSTYEFLITYLQQVTSFGPSGMVMLTSAIPPEKDRFNEKIEAYVINAPRDIPVFKLHINSKFLLSPLEKLFRLNDEGIWGKWEQNGLTSDQV